MRNYEIHLWWSHDDELFVAQTPELPGCMAHGRTQEEALANVKEAMELWIDVSTKAGDPVPEPGWRRILQS